MTDSCAMLGLHLTMLASSSSVRPGVFRGTWREASRCERDLRDSTFVRTRGPSPDTWRATRASTLELLTMSAVVVMQLFLALRTIAPLLFAEFLWVPLLPCLDFLIHANLAIAATAIPFAFVPIEVTERLVLPTIGAVLHVLLEESDKILRT